MFWNKNEYLYKFVNVQKARNFRIDCARYSAALRCCSNDVFWEEEGLAYVGFTCTFCDIMHQA